MLCSLESIFLKCDDSLPFNGDPASSSYGKKWSTSSASDSVDVSAKSKEESFTSSYPNHHNCHSNLECKVETSDIEDFGPNSFDHRAPSGCEVKESEAKAHDSISNETQILTSNHHSFVVDFGKKNFEDHLKDATSHLKDYFIHSSSTSRISTIDDSTSSSFLRIDNSIKIASSILDKKIDEILHFDFKNLGKVFETSNDASPKPSSDLTFEPGGFIFFV